MEGEAESGLTDDQIQAFIDKSYDVYTDQQKMYDKLVVALSGGAMSLSFTFLLRIDHHDRAWQMDVAWLCWCTSLMFALASHAISAELSLRQAKELAGKEPRRDRTRLRCWLRVCNIAAGALLGVGMLAAAGFAIANFW